MPYVEDLIEMSEVEVLLSQQEELRSLGHRVVYNTEGTSTNVAGIFIPQEKLRSQVHARRRKKAKMAKTRQKKKGRGGY